MTYMGKGGRYRYIDAIIHADLVHQAFRDAAKATETSVFDVIFMDGQQEYEYASCWPGKVRHKRFRDGAGQPADQTYFWYEDDTEECCLGCDEQFQPNEPVKVDDKIPGAYHRICADELGITSNLL